MRSAHVPPGPTTWFDSGVLHRARHRSRRFVDQLLDYDPYFLLADFRSYCDTQRHVGETYQDTERWVRMSILNSARSGKFSSDRTIAEYCREIWDVQPLSVDLFVDHESLMQ